MPLIIERQALISWLSGFYITTTGLHTWRDLAEGIAEQLAAKYLGDGTVKSITVKDAAWRWARGDEHFCQQEFASMARTRGHRKRHILGWEPKRGKGHFENHLAFELKRMVLENENECLGPLKRKK